MGELLACEIWALAGSPEMSNPGPHFWLEPRENSRRRRQKTPLHKLSPTYPNPDFRKFRGYRGSAHRAEIGRLMVRALAGPG